MDIDIVEDLKQPEYTGENRCEPCTILNLAIAGVVGSLIARKSKVGGLIAVGISIALIYLRGYLVPGTPTLTKRYLPPEVLRWFGKEPEPDVASGLGAVDTAPSGAAAGGADDEFDAADEVTTYDEDAVAERDADSGADRGDDADEDGPLTPTDPAEETVPNLERYFLEHDILEPCEDRDDLCLTGPFEDAWLESIETVDEAGIDAVDAADAFGFEDDLERFDLESRGEQRLLVGDRGVVGRWPSRAALLADVAASRVLAERAPDWDTHDSVTKGQILNGLRMFLETCPTGGDISMSEEVVESCCSSHDVFAVTCDESGERLFEQRLDTVDV